MMPETRPEASAITMCSAGIAIPQRKEKKKKSKKVSKQTASEDKT